jgi:hypothetical protein
MPKSQQVQYRLMMDETTHLRIKHAAEKRYMTMKGLIISAALQLVDTIEREDNAQGKS